MIVSSQTATNIISIIRRLRRLSSPPRKRGPG